MRDVAVALLRVLGAPVLLTLVTTTASAQRPDALSSGADAGTAAQQPVSRGPLTVERIPSGWAVSLQSDRIRFAGRGVAAASDADLASRYRDIYGTAADRVADIVFGRSRFHAPDLRPPTPVTPDTRTVFSEVFFVAEPQPQMMWSLSSRVRLTFGAGYRVTAGADPVNDRLPGSMGSVSIEFGGGH